MQHRKLSDPEQVFLTRERKFSDPPERDHADSRHTQKTNECDANNLITLSLILLCTLAALDLWRQVALKSGDYWYVAYVSAAKSSENFWKLGFHIEDLEKKIQHQSDKFELIRHEIGVLNPPLRHSHEKFTRGRLMQNTVHRLLGNDTSVVQIRCEDLRLPSHGNVLRVGFSDFRADPMDKCQVFTSTADNAIGPHMMFETVPLDEGAFALKNIGTDLFVQVVPPAGDGSLLPWKLILGSWSVGAGERFRLTSEGYLYSPLMRGLMQCSTDKPVLGYTGPESSGSKFLMEKVAPDQVHDALVLAELSRQILEIQTNYIKHKAVESARLPKTVDSHLLGNPDAIEMPIHVAIAVPVTSKGTLMTQINDSPFWSNLFDSFMKSIDWRSNKLIFKFFIGFDKADPLYDTGDAWSEMRDEFRHRAEFRMTEQLMEQKDIDVVFKEKLSLKLMHFDHLEGAPTQVVSQLVLQAYSENFDYFYQVNDDTVLVTPNWATELIKTLASNPLIPNFGVTGPKDVNNDKIFTHSFTHRTHIDIFGHLFPPSFKNWWSDDWITTVYGSEHTFRPDNIEIKHNIGAQKLGGRVQRYEVDMAAQLRLRDELLRGYVQIDKWLKKNSLPRLALPAVCGYVPLVSELKDVLKQKPKKDPVPAHDHTIH